MDEIVLRGDLRIFQLASTGSRSVFDDGTLHKGSEIKVDATEVVVLEFDHEDRNFHPAQVDLGYVAIDCYVLEGELPLALAD